MRLLLTKGFKVPEVWFAALLFPFKLLTVGMTMLLLIWYIMLPPNHSNAQTGFDHAWYSACEDFTIVAFGMSFLFYLAAIALMIGGLIQLFKYSRQAALLSFAFGVFALIVGIFITVGVSSPEGYFEIFRSVH
jgi:hypothetical protein